MPADSPSFNTEDTKALQKCSAVTSTHCRESRQAIGFLCASDEIIVFALCTLSRGLVNCHVAGATFMFLMLGSSLSSLALAPLTVVRFP